MVVLERQGDGDDGAVFSFRTDISFLPSAGILEDIPSTRSTIITKNVASDA